MKARLEIEANGRVVLDRMWKDPKQFVQNSTRSFRADKLRLDIQLEDHYDIAALKDWCDMALISLQPVGGSDIELDGYSKRLLLEQVNKFKKKP